VYSPTGLVAAVGLFRLFHVLLTFTGFRARAKGYKLSAAMGLRLHDALTRCCARGAYWGLFPYTTILRACCGTCQWAKRSRGEPPTD